MTADDWVEIHMKLARAQSYELSKLLKKSKEQLRDFGVQLHKAE
jgi:hypothetical protein